jgi:hypothetical protein
MTWTAVESSALQAAAYAEHQALLYLLFRSGEVYRYFEFPSGSIKNFWRRIPKADTSGAIYGDASVMSACAGHSDDSTYAQKSRD